MVLSEGLLLSESGGSSTSGADDPSLVGEP
jgi:hypothetical protein